MMHIRILFVLFCVLLFGFNQSISSQDCPFTLSVPQDITICDESFVLLDGDIVGPYLNFEWSSNHGYSQTSNLNPTVWVDRNTTFTLTAFGIPSQNLIINGDFSQGNIGFTTQYLYMPNISGIQNELGNEGTYSVHTNPNDLHSNFANCQDQSGGGNMMILNGGGSFQQVWCQNVSVDPNTSYTFSAWATSVISASPAILQFSINGVLLGSPFSLSSSVCNWQEFFTAWNSGANTTAQICITNNNTSLSGNDFAIDNIYFGPLCEDELSFNVTLETFEIFDFQPSVIDCTYPTSEIIAIVSPDLNFDYLWSTTNGIIESNTNTSDIVVSASGAYTVTVTSNNGCTQEQTFYVDSDTTNPDIFIEGNLILDCLNNSTILTGYTGVSNAQIFWQRPNGTIDYESTISVSTPGIYTVVVTGPNGCVTDEEVEVLLNIPNLIYETTTDSLTCTKESALITVHVITPIDSIVWEGNNILYSSSNGDSITVGDQGAYYFTLFLGGNCSFTDSIVVAQIPPNFSYEWPNFDTLDCNNNETVLFLLNPQNITNIVWEDSNKNIVSVDTLRVETSGQFYVTITDGNGCSILDSVTVMGDFDLPQFEVTLDSIDCINNFGRFYANIPAGSKILWQGPGLYTTDLNPIIDNSGDYTLMVTGENGCTSTQVLSMPTSQNFPVISYSISHISCLNPDGRIELDVNIPAQIFWISPDNIMGTDRVINSQTSGEFFIEAVTNKGCRDSIWISLDVDTLAPMLSIISNEILTCTNETIIPTVVASDYTRFVWTGPNGDLTLGLSPTISSPGEYFLTLINEANGCKTEQSFVVDQDIEKPSLSVEYQDLDCNNPVTILEILSPNANQFFVNGNISGSNSFIVSAPGEYNIIARGINGCDSIIDIEINGFFDAHQAELPEISLNCFKDSLWLIDINYNSNVIYNWIVDGNILTEDSLLVQASTNGFLETTNMYGCKSVFPLIIQSDFEKPLLEIDGPKVIGCNEEFISLIAMSSSENIVFSWWTQGQALSEQPSIQIDTSGIFALVGLNPANGCFSQIEIAIFKEVGPESVELEVVQPLCFGENGRVEVQNIIGGTSPFSILVNNQIRNINTPMILASGVYNLEIMDAKGCGMKTEIRIDQPEDFQISAGDDIEMNLGDYVILQGTSTLQFPNIKNIDWSPTSSLNCSDCLQPSASPTSDTEYELIVTDMNGCTKADRVSVSVKILKGYTAPNVLYLNSTMGNNTFTIYSLFNSVRGIKSLKIFDRWGNNVFSVKNSLPDDISLGWNGLHGGRYAELGVYMWVAELEYIDNSLEIVAGDITILR